MPEAEESHEYTWHLTLTRCPPDGPPVSAFYNRYPTAHEAVQVGARLLIEEGLLPRFALVWETHRDGARIDWQVAEITTRGTLAKYFWRCQTRGPRVPPAYGAEWLAAMYPRASHGDNQGDNQGDNRGDYQGDNQGDNQGDIGARRVTARRRIHDSPLREAPVVIPRGTTGVVVDWLPFDGERGTYVVDFGTAASSDEGERVLLCDPEDLTGR